MFTLYFPISLPEGRGLFSNGFEYPAIKGGLHLGLLPATDDIPLHTLVVTGFETLDAAAGFVPELQTALRIASVHLGYSIGFSGKDACAANSSNFDGAVPTVLPASTPARPYYTSSSTSYQIHVSNIAGLVSSALNSGANSRANDDPGLALSLQLHADSDFAGGTNARFMVLVTAIEVLVEGTGGSKRNAAKAMVKRSVSKACAKRLDILYGARNALVHDGVAVTTAQLSELRAIVGQVLKARFAPLGQLASPTTANINGVPLANKGTVKTGRVPDAIGAGKSRGRE